ncbi:hypothetical protein [Chitinimonas sp. BJB300]|uniref:hypothetical protein n=1 Tax=Chitinimonas sp. BJB300 TaxID=1559339 RepID=UPI000C108541|nr:hypothetical protein [Chitinimonas sp. BJB300]PHV11297.1 hypothetical protein CSQ89_11695 [Chitinimonas sp. BJB300]TSJ91568.1 hypothetical protein FG002_004670 [Chitinimonas sp. BJB300]
MHALELPPLDPSQSLEFADARGFKEWLKLVPMINVRQAHDDVLNTLSRLNISPVLPIERLKMLELLRESVAMLQEENAKRYFGRPFPLAAAEDSAWQDNLRLWLAMSQGYRHCWLAGLKHDVTVADHCALCGQRAIRYAALAIREYHLAYRSIPQARWADIYDLYQIATKADIANKTVKDSLNTQTELSSCTASFLQAALLAAANPSAMPVRQLIWTDRLLDRWSNQTTLLTEPPERSDRGALALDLEEASELKRYDPIPVGPSWRYVDIDPVGKRIKKRIKSLRAGELPAQLGLGEDFAASTAESNLVGLFHEWCDLPLERGMPRHQSLDDATPAQLALGLNTAHQAISGKLFTQPDELHEVRGRAIADFQLFGGQAHHLSSSNAAKEVAALPELESWLMENESALGFKLNRQGPGGRLNHSQLIAVKPRPDQPIVVGSVRWLEEGGNGELNIGVRLLPGIPRAVSVRLTGVNNFGSQFTQALLLPAMPALHTETSLLVPNSWHKAGKIIEIYVDGQIRKIKLEQMIERGQDFERVTFQGDLS